MAAITISNLTSAANGASVTSFATASISPTNGDYIIIAVNVSTGSPQNVPTATQAGITFSLITSVQSASRTATRTTLLGGYSNGTAGAITVDFGGQSNFVIGHVVDRVQNMATSSPIIQSASSDANTTQTGLTPTLATLQNANNAAYGVAFWGGGAAITVGASFTALGRQDAAALLSEWALNKTQVPFTWASANNWSQAIAIEISVPKSPSGFFNFFQ